MAVKTKVQSNPSTFTLVYLPAGDVPVKLPLLPEDGVTADVTTLVAPLLLWPQVVLHSGGLEVVVVVFVVVFTEVTMMGR
jgi:hypothetical protein